MPVVTRTLDLKPIAKALDELKAPVARLSAWKPPAPKITSLDPAEHVEQKGFALEVHGSGFAKGAQVGVTSMSGAYYWDDKPTLHDATHLTAKVADGYGAGEHKVRVWNPGDLYSNEFPFKLTPKAKKVPEITSIEPKEHIADESFPLAVRGRNFNKESQVLIGIAPLATKWRSPSRLDATVMGTLDGPRDYEVTVTDNDGESKPVTLKITVKPKNPPVITSIYPEKHVEGESFPLAVRGRNFNDDANVYVDGYKQSTRRQSSTRLDATIDHDFSVQSHDVVVTEEEGESSPKTLTITRKHEEPAPPPPPKPAPSNFSLRPDDVTEDSEASIRLYGDNLDSDGHLLRKGWGDVSKELISRKPLTMRLPGTWGSGQKELYWQNPGGQESNHATLTVRPHEHRQEPKPPMPTLQSLDPDYLGYKEEMAVQFHGTNFRDDLQLMTSKGRIYQGITWDSSTRMTAAGIWQDHDVDYWIHDPINNENTGRLQIIVLAHPVIESIIPKQVYVHRVNLIELHGHYLLRGGKLLAQYVEHGPGLHEVKWKDRSELVVPGEGSRSRQVFRQDPSWDYSPGIIWENPDGIWSNPVSLTVWA